MTVSWYFGIDPGSSKPWPVFRARCAGGAARPILVESSARVWRPAISAARERALVATPQNGHAA